MRFISKLNFVAHGVKFGVLELICTYAPQGASILACESLYNLFIANLQSLEPWLYKLYILSVNKLALDLIYLLMLDILENGKTASRNFTFPPPNPRHLSFPPLNPRHFSFPPLNPRHLSFPLPNYNTLHSRLLTPDRH